MSEKTLNELQKAHNMFDYDLVLELTGVGTQIQTKIQNQRNLAYEKGGFRERYAMDNGTEKIVEYGGHKCLRYDYDHNDPYQDANGAMWDMTKGTWIY